MNGELDYICSAKLVLLRRTKILINLVLSIEYGDILA